STSIYVRLPTKVISQPQEEIYATFLKTDLSLSKSQTLKPLTHNKHKHNTYPDIFKSKQQQEEEEQSSKMATPSTVTLTSSDGVEISLGMQNHFQMASMLAVEHDELTTDFL